MKPLALIGAAIGAGASDPGCRDGPHALRAHGLAARLAARGRPAWWSAMLMTDDAPAGSLAAVETFAPRLAGAVGAAMSRGALPVVIGGDHSCAVGTWSAVAAALAARGRLGLIWIDAHLDSHTPRTSPTQAPHGMPLAALLGHGSAGLTGLCGDAPKLDARDVAVIGARSWEPGEAALLARLGVRVYPMGEVRARGLATCVREAAARVTARTAGFGVSVDLDALDPRDAPGTGAPVPGGIRLREAVSALAPLAADARLAALELVEYDPSRDPGRITAAAAEAVLGALTGAGARPAALRKAA